MAAIQSAGARETTAALASLPLVGCCSQERRPVPQGLLSPQHARAIERHTRCSATTVETETFRPARRSPRRGPVTLSDAPITGGVIWMVACANRVDCDVSP